MKNTITILTLFFSGFTAFGQEKFEDLDVDTTITDFHLAADFQGTIIFTKNGPSDIQTMNPTAFSFTIAPGMTSTQAKEQLDFLVNMSIQNGIKVLDVNKKDTTLNGYEAFIISYTEQDEINNYKNLVFNAFVIKNNTVILFTSGDLANGKYREKFKKTFYSIKI